MYSSMVAVSDSVMDTLHSYPKSYSRLVKRIYNGIPLAPPAAKDIRSIWAIPSNKPLLVSVGRLSLQKNHGTLLKALACVPEAHLVIVGDGELAADLKEQSRSLGLSARVRFTGEIPAEDVSACLQAADLFVFPSRWESMGLAVLEAMQAGLPVVASDIPAMREVLGDSALLVPPEDAGALALAILRVLQDSEMASRLRSRVMQRVKLFSAETMISQYVQLLAP
jgi:glycosyltransferase involved in cell wall biosynthesis